MARKSIATRVVAIATVTGLIGTAGAALSSLLAVHGSAAERLIEVLQRRYDRGAASACQAAPAFFAIDVGRSGVAFAYDEATLRSRNPDAPPLRKDLRARLPPGQDGYVVGFSRRFGVVILMRRRAAAPCDLVQLTAEPPPTRVSRFLTAEGLGALTTGLISSLLALALGLPLARRVRRLGAAAVSVGAAGGYAPSGAAARGDEVDALGAALDKAHARIRSDAELLERRRTSLQRHLAEVAHDLRTPLTSLQAALERATDAHDAETARELLTSALFDVVYLSGLTDNLRLASQLRDGWDPGLARAPVDLGELLDRVGTRARLLARRRDVAVEIAIPDAPLVVEIDRVAGEQALTNVVQNAVAYVDPGGHVAIVLRAEDGGGAFTIDVRDDGPGVPPAELPQLGYGTFRSDEARQRDPRGRGIGLGITSEVCARFGWELSFYALEPRGLGVRVRGTVDSGRRSSVPGGWDHGS